MHATFQDIMLKQFSGDGGSEPQVKEVSGACHQKFRTLTQAEAFIEDWKKSFADACGRALKDILDHGYRPNNMKLNLESFLSKTPP